MWRGWLTVVLWTAISIAAPGILGAESPGKAFTKVREILDLPREVAVGEAPFLIRGTVTYSDPGSSTYFIQDETGGISWTGQISDRSEPIRQGDWLELRGVTTAGGFAPALIARSVERLGTKPLPVPLRAGLDRLLTGREDCQWVSTLGVLQDVKRVGGNLELLLWTPAGLFTGYLLARDDAAPLTDWIDAGVELRGVCITKFTMRSQMIGFEMVVQGIHDLAKIRPAPADPFQLSETRIDQILSYVTGQEPGHRVRIRGVATLRREDGLAFVQSGNLGLRMELLPGQQVELGEEIEAVGFPKPGLYGPSLERVLIRRGKKIALPAPKLLDEAPLDGSIDAVRVTASGTVLGSQLSPVGLRITVASGTNSFEVLCPPPRTAEGRPVPTPGSRIQMTGVASIMNNSSMGPPELQLHMNSKDDIVVLAGPPWYASEHTWKVLLGLLVLCVLGAAWVAVLRRTVRRQTDVLQAKIENERALERRFKEMTENASDMIYTVDLEGRITGVNPAVERILGYTPAECLDMSFESILLPESHGVAREALARKIRGEVQSAVYVVQVRSKRGAVRAIEISSRGVLRGGALHEIEGVARDVTDREAARSVAETRQAKLRRSNKALIGLVQRRAFQEGTLQERLRAITESAVVGTDASRAGVWMLSVDGLSLETVDRFEAEHGGLPDVLRVAIGQAPRFFTALGEARFLSSEDALAEPQSRELAQDLLLPHRVASLLAGAVRLEGRLLGCVCIEHTGSKRAWTAEEQMFAASIADLTSLAFGSEQTRLNAQALRESDRRLRVLVESLAEGVMLLGGDGRFLDCNPSAERILGIPASRIKGGSIFDSGWNTLREDGSVFPPDEYPAVVTLRTGKPVSNVVMGVRRPDGACVWISISTCAFQFEGDGRASAVVVSFGDITLRKQAEATLLASEERYRRLVENSTDMVAEVTADAKYVYLSPSWHTLLGYPSEMLQGQDIFERIHPEDQEMARECFRKEISATLRFSHRNGGWRVLECSGRSFTTPSGEERGVIICRDVTERDEAEHRHRIVQEQLYQSQKMEALGTLAGGIAHDFNNLLGSILGNTDLLLMDVRQGHPMHETIEDILKATHRARDLVRQILSFSRKQAQPREAVDLGTVLRDTLRLIRPSIPAGVKLVVPEWDRHPPLRIDATRARIEQIILNLASNALDAMKSSGGTLEFGLRLLHLAPDSPRLKPPLSPGPHVEFLVRDSGHGIPFEAIPRVYEPFFTTKAPGSGTGLGLAVVHGIVRDHGATIDVESAPNQGTLFTVLFPALTEELPAPLEADPGDLPVRGRNERILVVDDEPSLVLMQTKLLGRLGYQPEGFTNPVDAWTTFSAEPDRFDLVLTDLTMPQMNGIELARQMLALRPGLPVILCTGFGGTFDAEQTRLLGIREFLAKPVAVRALAGIVDDLLQGSVKSSLGSEERFS